MNDLFFCRWNLQGAASSICGALQAMSGREWLEKSDEVHDIEVPLEPRVR